MSACSRFLFISTFFIFAGFNHPVVAAEEEEAAPVPSCHEKLTRAGRVNTIEAVASVSAIGEWISAAQEKYGEDFLWAYAKGTDVSCNKKAGSLYYMCYASGKPCEKPKFDEQAGKSN